MIFQLHASAARPACLPLLDHLKSAHQPHHAWAHPLTSLTLLLGNAKGAVPVQQQVDGF